MGAIPTTPIRRGLMAGAALAVFIAGSAAAQDAPTQEQLWDLVRKQQQQIEALQQKVDALQRGAAPAAPSAGAAPAASPEVQLLERRVQAAEAKVEATAAALEKQLTVAESDLDKTTIGGYGELHYNGGKVDDIDFHRFVLLFGHRFNDWITFHSELELEHALAGEGKKGEVEIEQAYLDFDLSRAMGGAGGRHYARAGLFLVPVGILNETHEPPTFFGVERNPVETNIIPTTWWEAGVGMHGQIGGGFSYDLAAHSGLNVPIAGGNAFRIRNGRQKVSEASMENAAVTGRLRWTGVPGIELGISGQYQGDVTQGQRGVEATLLSAHADLRRGPLGLRALYARWDLDGAAPKLSGRDEQYGWYVEPSYRLVTRAGVFGAFARYAVWDNEAGLTSADTKNEQTTIGLNYWPHPNVVLKADYQFDDPPPGRAGDDRINLGVGYQF